LETSQPTKSPNLRSSTNLPTISDVFYPTGDNMATIDTIAPWTDAANQDSISANVAITRDYRGGIFNALVDGDLYSEYTAPSGTMWALLPEGKSFEQARCSLQFCEWNTCFSHYDTDTMLYKPGVVHLVEEDLYYNIMFTNWTKDPYDGGPDGLQNYGGGFQYVRDESPIAYDDSVPCPNCDLAKPTLKELTGPLDYSLREVGIAGVVPSNATVTITAVSQDRSQQYSAKSLPNAVGLGNSTVQLRRTTYIGELVPLYYTVYFTAKNAAGYCYGQVSVCSAAEGFDCDTHLAYGYDATSTKYTPNPN
jgi:hypothetical protein